MIERKFETLLTQYGQAMQKLAVSGSADRERASAKAVRAKAILRGFLKDELEAARATAEQSRDSADAARYRWLRDIGDATWAPMAHRDRYCTASGIDAAIDAAIESQRSGDGS